MTQKVKVKCPKIGQNLKNRLYDISDSISPTDFILRTKVQPNNAHSTIQVTMTLALGQGHWSGSNFPIMGKKLKQLAKSLMLLHQHTSYFVPRYNPIRNISMIQVTKVKVKMSL